jgi:hypothetical protein
MVVLRSKRKLGGQVLNRVRKKVLRTRDTFPEGNGHNLVKEKVVRESNDIFIVVRAVIIVRAA